LHGLQHHADDSWEAVELHHHGHLMPGSEAETAALVESYMTAQQELAKDAALASGVHDGRLTGARESIKD
jgi:hypothetical protein